MVLFFRGSNILLFLPSPEVDFTVFFPSGAKKKPPTKLIIRPSAEMGKKTSTNFDFWHKIWQKMPIFSGKNAIFSMRFFFLPNPEGKEKTVKFGPSFIYFCTTNSFICYYREKKKTIPLCLEYTCQALEYTCQALEYTCQALEYTCQA